MFGETAGIQCACMALFAISYSTLKEVNRWDQFDLDIILINGDALYKSLRRQTLLTVEDLPRYFKMGEETVFAQFRENKYGIFNWGLQKVHATLLENLVQNPESQSTGSIFFIQGMCFAIIPFSSHYYIFDSHSRDNIGQASENGSSVLLKFLTIKHVLNFIITTYLVNSELQHVCEKQFVFFPETKISIRRRTLRRFRQGYRNIFPYKDYANPLDN